MGTKKPKLIDFQLWFFIVILLFTLLLHLLFLLMRQLLLMNQPVPRQVLLSTVPLLQMLFHLLPVYLLS